MLGMRSRRRGSGNILLANRLLKLAFFGTIAVVVFGVLLFFWYGRDLPTPEKLSASNLSQSTKIFDRDEILLYDIYEDQNRTYVELKDIAKTLQLATIAIEDKDFYTNDGYSIWGYLRAARDAIIFRQVTGASTLTQQLVKNTLLTSERSLPRKIKEFILAIEVDKRYTKNQVLELYLNVAPYGGTSVGVEAASEGFFGKKAKDLTLVESAILAALPQQPTYYNPHGNNPKAYIDRTTDVLRRMREDEYITKKQEADAVKALPNVKFKVQQHAIKAPHFSFYVKDLLVKQFGEKMVQEGGLQVTTTLNYKLQEKAEEIVLEEVDAARLLKVSNGASLVMDPNNGEILAMIGSKDFFATESATTKKGETVTFDGQFNIITQALRQPGSSIKPVMYATALEKGYTAASLIMDTKTIFPNQGEKDYEPHNYDGKFHGPIQMRFALANSFNITAVKMLALIGVKNMLTTANNIGLTTLAPTDENVKRFGLSITLGGGEVHVLDMATAYSAFANGGNRVEPVAILKVTDRKGKVLYEHNEASPKRVLSEEVAFIISNILLDNSARTTTFGSNSYLNITSRQVAVKTGTTDDKRDNWTIGWTPNVVVVTWVGNNDNSPMGNVASGVTGAAPIWRKIILEAVKGRPNEEFKKPENVVEVTIDALGGGQPVDGQGTRKEFFIKGTEPQGPGSIYKQIKVSKEDTNKLASDSEIEKGEYETRKFIVFTESDPFSGDGKNRWQEGIDEWVRENKKDDPLYKAPTEKSTRTVSDKPTETPTPTPSPIP